MKKLLLSPEEQFDFFIEVYGKVIDLKEVSDEEGKEICKLFKDFIKAALINLKILLPINDTVTPQQYHEFYEEVSGWTFDNINIKLTNLRKQYQIIQKC